MPSCENFYESALRLLGELKSAQDQAPSLLEYYQAVLAAQADVASSRSCAADSLDLELCRERLSRGAPALAPEAVRVDWALFDDLFESIGRLSRRDAETPDSDGRPPAISGCSRRWHERLLEGLLQEKGLLPELADEAGLSPEMLAFLACQALAPFLESHARRVKGLVDEAAWLRGNCPVCGGEPLMGRLEKETGKRLLECHLCRTEWAFKRLECPFCGNSDQEKLRFFSEEGDRVYRVEVCDACKAYLKTVDTRDTEREIVLFVENLATIHLDLVAGREGFRRDTNRLFGL